MGVTSHPVPSRPSPSLSVSFCPVSNELAFHLGYRGRVEFQTVRVAAAFNVTHLTCG